MSDSLGYDLILIHSELRQVWHCHALSSQSAAESRKSFGVLTINLNKSFRFERLYFERLR